MSQQYDSDYAIPESPPLQQVKPKSTPSPSPPPFIPQRPIFISPESVSPHSSDKRKSSNRRKRQASQGDAVLIGFLAPNHPDIAREAGIRPLNSASQSEAEDSDDEMVDKEEGPPPSDAFSQAPTEVEKLDDLIGTAQAAVAAVQRLNAENGSETANAAPSNPDSYIGLNPDSRVKSSPSLPNDVPANGAVVSSDRPASLPSLTAQSPKPNGARSASLCNGYPSEDSLATSPHLRDLTIPQSEGSPGQTLPALQNSPEGSPNQDRKLPGFRQLSELAEVATKEQTEGRTNGYHPHRHSFSSTGGHSPTLVSRFPSGAQRSPPSQFSLSQTSPISAHSEVSPQDPFLKTTLGSHPYFFNRRPSQASENGPPYPALPSASTADSYSGSDGFSPGGQMDSHRMSIDGPARPILPPPQPSIQHIPLHGTGGFKCEHPGCNAPPFQTQYLLNSHANVHSQNRPHYCPVVGCPRGEGGKGFKRKNEMIRHGLVHDSPGYVCPFCPDREHKYPRPDNLQRHVRVHHMDKDKDDPQLREVLAQRPEGGSRGRRRRVGA